MPLYCNIQKYANLIQPRTPIVYVQRKFCLMLSNNRNNRVLFAERYFSFVYGECGIKWFIDTKWINKYKWVNCTTKDNFMQWKKKCSYFSMENSLGFNFILLEQRKAYIFVNQLHLHTNWSNYSKKICPKYKPYLIMPSCTKAQNVKIY